MAEWDGENGDGEFRYLWENIHMDNVGDEWDFDALNEDGVDWSEQLWHEPLAPAAQDAPNDNSFRPEFSPLPPSTVASTPLPQQSPFQSHATRLYSPPSDLPATPLRRPISNDPSLASANNTNAHSLRTPHSHVPNSHSSPENLLQRHLSNSSRLYEQRNAAQTNDYLPNHMNQPRPPRRAPADYSSPISTSISSFDGIDIEELLNSDISSLEEEDEDMPPHTRRSQQSSGSVVDLTQDSQVEDGTVNRQPRSRKRSAEASLASLSGANKRPRHSQASTSQHHKQPVEELDLTNEAPSAEEELRQAQQQAAIAAQQAADEGHGPLRIGKRQCIICMEPFTNVTITHCGHVYCHECLTQALLAGEKNSERGIGNCPVCRKPVSRKKANQMVVVSFMKKSAFKGKAKSAGSW